MRAGDVKSHLEPMGFSIAGFCFVSEMGSCSVSIWILAMPLQVDKGFCLPEYKEIKQCTPQSICGVGEGSIRSSLLDFQHGLQLAYRYSSAVER